VPLPRNPASAKCLKWGTRGADTWFCGRQSGRAAVRGDSRRGARRADGRPYPGSPQALRAADRQRPTADAGRGARARTPQGRGRRGGQASADRVQPAARDVDHPPLHARRRAPARPDPGGQPGPHPCGREVRLHARLQALHVCHVVDPPVDLARARRAGPDDPAARPRGRPGAPGHARPPHARPEVQPRPEHRGDRGGGRDRARESANAARARAGSRLARHSHRGRGERDQRRARGRERDRARGRQRRPVAVRGDRPCHAGPEPRQQRVLTERFGLQDGKPKTLEEVGAILGITRERVRQLETRALRELRSVAPSLELYLRT
jgi:hypothetical protein